MRFWFLSLLFITPVFGQTLHQAVRDNDIDRVVKIFEAQEEPLPAGSETLIETRVDGATPLLLASFLGYGRMSDLLLSEGAYHMRCFLELGFLLTLLYSLCFFNGL